MARTRLLLTAELARQIVAFARAGGFPHVAAEAAGVSRDVFEAWLRRGQGRGAEPYRSFRRDVFQAHAQARLRAEVAVLEDKPFEWLRAGPARDTPAAPGWASPVRPRPPEPAGGNFFADPAAQRLVRRLLDMLGPFPDLRAGFADALRADVPEV
jgi:hypothetical protein